MIGNVIRSPYAGQTRRPGDGSNRPGARPHLVKRYDMAKHTAPCKVPDCDRKRPRQGRGGYCAMHAHRLARYGHLSDTHQLLCPDCGQHWTWTICPGQRPRRCQPCKATRERARRRPGLNHLESARQWAARNPDKVRAARSAWKRANPEPVRASRRTQKKRNPEANRSYNRARHARKRGLTVVPFSPAQLGQRLAYYGGRCWMCGEHATTIDHVKPIARHGAHMLCNLRPACMPCNSSKGDRWPWPTRTIFAERRVSSEIGPEAVRQLVRSRQS